MFPDRSTLRRCKRKRKKSEFAVQCETFTMATSVAATNAFENNAWMFTLPHGEICKPVHKEQNSLIIMQLHSRLIPKLLTLLPGEIYATKETTQVGFMVWNRTQAQDENLHTTFVSIMCIMESPSLLQ